MKKTGLFFLSILLVGVFIFREGNFLGSNPSLTISQHKFLLSDPSWFLTNKNTNFTYKLISKQASQNDSDEAFLIKEPMLEAIFNEKVKNSISSEEARLELYNEKLIMKKKVHYKLINDKEITHLYSEQINLDLKNNTASTGLVGSIYGLKVIMNAWCPPDRVLVYDAKVKPMVYVERRPLTVEEANPGFGIVGSYMSMRYGLKVVRPEVGVVIINEA